MKKNVLALSITAAVAAIGFAGSAQAIGLAQPITESPIPAGAGTRLVASSDGVGQFLYVPYYSAQSGNNTMINLVNTDTVNGKAVKVRFRSAGNSDDVFDFQVFLSPADVWTVSVTKDTDGKAKVFTADASCTKPGKVALNAASFSTLRSDPKRTGDALPNEGREGYVEIFNMADIKPGTDLFTAIKHKANVAPCTGTAWTALESDPINEPAANAKGLYVPTTGLFANWTILNANDAGAWSGAATAINAVDGLGNITTGALTYFPQTNLRLIDQLPAGLTPDQLKTRLAQFTADKVLIDNYRMAAVYDVPDFSIPYTSNQAPTAQASALSGAIATRRIFNEFLNDSSLAATTDWVLSMPTRRYYVAYDYIADMMVKTENHAQPFFNEFNTTVIDRQVCIKNISHVSYNQEETTSVAPDIEVVVSPQIQGESPSFIMCGEASVLSFNAGEKASASGLITSASGTLKATVARSAIENGYGAGWTTLFTPAPFGDGYSGLPILGYQAVRAQAGTHTFGATLPHRTDRLEK